MFSPPSHSATDTLQVHPSPRTPINASSKIRNKMHKTLADEQNNLTPIIISQFICKQACFKFQASWEIIPQRWSLAGFCSSWRLSDLLVSAKGRYFGRGSLWRLSQYCYHTMDRMQHSNQPNKTAVFLKNAFI